MFTARKKAHLGQNLTIWFICICINITNRLSSFLSVFFLLEGKNITPIFFIKSEIKWLGTFYSCLLQQRNYSKRHWKFYVLEILKDLTFLWRKNYIDCAILVKVFFFLSQYFRGINESNGLKLQLVYKQLAIFNILRTYRKG